MDSQIRSITIDEAHGFAIDAEPWPQIFPRLRILSNMIDLSVETTRKEPIDIHDIHASAPQLTRLCVNVYWPPGVTNPRALQEFTRLRVLKLVVVRAWDMETLVGMQQLEELYTHGSSIGIGIKHIQALALLRPLRVLDFRLIGWDDSELLLPLATHLPTLRELCAYTRQPWPLTYISQATQARHLVVNVDLRLTRTTKFLSLPQLLVLDIRAHEGQIDLEPLVGLVSLERLSLTMHHDATDCCALRHLKKLRWLYLESGWVRDFIAYLPRLETLEIHDFTTDQRSFCEPEAPLVGFHSPIRHARLYVSSLFALVDQSSFMEAVLANTEQLTVHFPPKTPYFLAAIWRLCNVKRRSWRSAWGVFCWVGRAGLPPPSRWGECVDESERQRPRLRRDATRWTCC